MKEYRGYIREDLQELKHSVRPLVLVKDLVSSFIHPNGSASANGKDKKGDTASGSSLLQTAASFLPGRYRTIAKVATIVLPVAAKNLPVVWDFIKGQKKVFKKANILGWMRKGVHALRKKIHVKGKGKETAKGKAWVGTA